MAIALMLAAISVAQAQNTELKNFCKELSALAGGGIECAEHNLNFYIKDELLLQLDAQLGGKDVANKLIERMVPMGEGKKILIISTNNEAAYSRLSSFFEKKGVDTAEELCGVPLFVNTRNDGVQIIQFMSEENSIIINDYAEHHEYGVTIAECNLLEYMKKMMMTLMGDDEIDVIVGNKENLSFTLAADSTIEFNGDACEVDKVSFDKVCAPLYKENLREPSFVPNNEGGYCVAIPALSEEERSVCRPYALNGVYDWIEETGFSKGAGKNLDQVSEIITPYSVVRSYCTGNSSLSITHNRLADIQKHLVAEYQGGVPAVLYRKSLTPEGYKDVISDLEPFFTLQSGEWYRNMRLVNRIDSPDGSRFVQLYADRAVFMSIYDSPADNYCCMSIVQGDEEVFAALVDDYSFEGESNLASENRIVIGDNGVRFIDSKEVDGACGISFDFEYYKKINNKQ